MSRARSSKLDASNRFGARSAGERRPDLRWGGVAIESGIVRRADQ